MAEKDQFRPESLAAQAVKGSAYSIAASAVTMVLGFGRSVLMARLLAPEDFGVVAFAMTFLNFTTPLRDFGLDQALVHHKLDEDASLDDVLAVHFSLRSVLIGLFALLLLAATPILRYAYPQKTMLVPVLLGLTVGEIARGLGATPTAYLQKEMRFKSLIVLQVLTSLSMTVVGPLMAWYGWGVWAIVGERISGVIVATLFVWAFIRPWRLRLKFDVEKIKWYLTYGKFMFVTRILERVLEEFDDFWIGTSLGGLALGYYSKSYEFALYPRRIISDPLTKVVFPLFAKLQDNRLQLSKAYFRFSSLVIRTSFLVAGMLILSAEEFIVVLLGEKWLPAVIIFQLMIVYVLLDPLMIIGANLVQAVGHPEYWTRARVVQVVFFIPAVVLGSQIWQTLGVALAADLTLLIGLCLLSYRISRLVDISYRRIFGFPTFAFLVASSASWMLFRNLSFNNELIIGFSKSFTFILMYLAILLLTEHKEYREHANGVWQILSKGSNQRGQYGREVTDDRRRNE